jgi:transposase-like protein
MEQKTKSLLDFMHVAYSNDDKIFKFLKEFNLIQHCQRKSCANGHQMTIVRTTSNNDGYAWHCASCNISNTIRDNSIFQDASITISLILRIIFTWTTEHPIDRARQMLCCSTETVWYYQKLTKLIALNRFKKNEQRLGGREKSVLVDESLFVIGNSKIRVLGLYEKENTPNEIKLLLFCFPQKPYTAVDILNIIYQHVEPGSVVYTKLWETYNRIIESHEIFSFKQAANRSLRFAARDRSHANSMRSRWYLAQERIRQMYVSVPRGQLQLYLDECCWRLQNGNRDMWLILKASLKAITEYFDENDKQHLDREVERYDALLVDFEEQDRVDFERGDVEEELDKKRFYVSLGNMAELQSPSQVCI